MHKSTLRKYVQVEILIGRGLLRYAVSRFTSVLQAGKSIPERI